MILAALLAVATAAPADVGLEPGPHLAFIGELVSLQEAEDDEPCVATDHSICIPFDSLFDARYRVVLPLAGDPRAPELTIRIADHYGKPGFTEVRHALLVVTLGERRPYLQKYQGFAVYRVAGGGWATCGQDDSAARPAPQARALTYLEPIHDLRGEDPADVAAWRADPHLRIDGDKLYCARGVPVEEYLPYLRDGVLAARGVVLEPAPQAASP